MSLSCFTSRRTMTLLFQRVHMTTSAPSRTLDKTEHLGRSGLQREVLSLYRASLRAIRSKPKVDPSLGGGRGVLSSSASSLFSPHPLPLPLQDTQDKFRRFTRAQFTQHPEIGPRDVAATEHLLRVGKRQYEAYSSPDVTDVSWGEGT